MPHHFLALLIVFGILNLTAGGIDSRGAQSNAQGAFMQFNVQDEIESLRRQLNFETTMRMQFDKQLTTMTRRYRTLLEDFAKAKEENEKFKYEMLQSMNAQGSKGKGPVASLQRFGNRSNFTLLQSIAHGRNINLDSNEMLSDIERNISSLEEFIHEKYDEEKLQDIVIDELDIKIKKLKGEFRKMKNKLVKLTKEQNSFSSSVKENLNDIFNQISTLNNSVGLGLPGEKECSTKFEGCHIRDCKEMKIIRGPSALDGSYDIWPDGKTKKKVLCDMRDDGWTVFQRRQNGGVEFYRIWEDYKDGFGDPDDEYWLGNEYIHLLTVNKTCRLRIEMVNWNSVRAYAEYDDFSLDDEDSQYTLNIGKYNGNAGRDSLGVSSGNPFSTWDRDNDGWNAGNCAAVRSGAWWYRYWWCSYSNLNGSYNKTHDGAGVWWYNYPSADNMKSTKMMLLCS